MEQCSKHDTPLAFSVILTNQSGHALFIELNARAETVLTGQWLGDSIAYSAETIHPH